MAQFSKYMNLWVHLDGYTYTHNLYIDRYIWTYMYNVYVYNSNLYLSIYIHEYVLAATDTCEYM